MSLRTYTTKVKTLDNNEYTINVKAKKDYVSAIISSIKEITELNKQYKEITGVIGGQEYTAVYYSPFSTYEIKEVEDYHKEVNKWLNDRPDPLVMENYNDWVSEGQKIKRHYIPTIDKRRNPEQEQARIEASNKAAKEREEQARIKAEQNAIEQAELLKKYHFLERREDSKKSDWALAASNIRKLLKHEFPGHEFKVTSEAYSGGDSVDVSWEDGPTTTEVDSVIHLFKSGTFDPMTDCPGYRSSVFMSLFGDAKHVFSHRSVTDEAWEKVRDTEFTGWTCKRTDWQDVNTGHVDRKVRETSFYVKPEPKPEQTDQSHRQGKGTIEVEDEALQVLKDGRVEENRFYLPNRYLPRALYVSVDKVLKTLGGKWNRSQKCHIFPENVEENIANIIEGGEVIDTKKELQQFDTPPELAKRLIELAEIEPYNRVLEPSAGVGNLVKAMSLSPAGGSVVAVEIDSKRCETLKQTITAEIVNSDFLDCNGALGKFDRVVMNPPFTNYQDAKHVLHALGMLNEGGILVSIMSKGATFRDTGDYKTLKGELDNNGYAYEFLDVDDGAFKESGTMVTTCILKVWK